MDVANSLNISNTSVQTGQNAAQNAPVRKNEGSLFKNQPAQPAGTPSEQTVSNALDNVGKLVARVLDDLKSASSLSKAEQILSQAKDTKIAPNLASELSDLAKSLEVEAAQNESPEIKSLALKLKEFLKPIADLKAGSLNDQIKNSGVMLEANLKDALTPEKLPSSIQKLLSDIKNLSNQNLLSQILTLNDESLDNQNSFMKLTSMLEKASSDAKNLLDNSSIKTLLKDVDKLDNVAKFLDKNFSKEQSADAVKSQIGKMENFISNLSEKVANLASEKLNQNFGFTQNHKELKAILENLKNDLKMLNNIGDEAGLIKAFNELSDVSKEGSLQDKLQSAARRLAHSLSLADPEASTAKSELSESKALLKQLKLATNDINNITTKSQSEISKVLNQDVKSTLLNISEKSQNAQTVNAANKMISQIEMHQMVSSLQGGIQTYMPYIWDGVEGGNVAFKQGKKDKFYAQIDLNFKKFGQINVMVGLVDKRYIDLSVATQTNEFKELILSSSSELKQAISKLGLIVSNFNIKTLPKVKLNDRFKNFGGLDAGFDKKI
ncbi:flagellar hook-length control protein FliK [Campylobacter concisus]|uniref:Flagellar hook-length control protein FliK n=1 Tax=Campylobacter concisus TaxID=199 RepID=A0A7S9WSX5_9BACT|nr:flagellar hook-length control protein FliK [Campylobacter concisus]QPH92229.1 flagellar hook-length control protein FliK [Campylobacter concisus]